MAGYHFDFLSVAQNWNVLARGLAGTVELAVLSLAAGLALGLIIGTGRTLRHPLFRWPAAAYVEVFRNTPALVQIMWFFFAFPILVGVQLDAFLAASIALSLNTAAFCAEIFRGGIQSIEREQWEAGRALGMSYPALMRRIVLPQAVRRMIPAFTNRAIELAKMTSLASTIAFADLLYEGKLLSAVTYRPIETYTVVAAIYFVLLGLGTLLVRRLEVRLAQSD